MSGPSQGVHTDAAEVASSRKRSWLRRPVVLVIALLILAAIVVPLISLGRYHRTIADSLSRGLGHTVHIGSINLTLFPLPGLVIHDLVVEEDPAFGAEPLLRAPSVTVYPRLSSLWRERLEISRIDLDDASVNLVRDSAGRWNFSSLLLQASRTAAAPTAQRHPGPTLRFPYIGFSDARINFKEGYEKKAFSLLNSDASVWLADPNRWRIRLHAQPARTDLDLDLEDTGTIRLDGSVTRAPSLDQLPLRLHAEWNGAQLGQVSRLILGRDSGWRGGLRAEADLTGNMTSLVVRSRLSVADAHRIEFTPVNLLDLDARCDATYHHLQQSLDNLTCLLPTGDGHLLLTGGIPDLAHPQPDLNLEINHTPVGFAVSLLGLLRSGLSALVSASGTINGRFGWGPQHGEAQSAGAPPLEFETWVARENAPAEILTGQAVADTVSVNIAGIDHPFTFAALRFATPAAENPSPARKRLHALTPKLRSPGIMPADHQSGEREAHMPGRPVPQGWTVLLEPAAFAAGVPRPMQVSGQFSRAGFSLRFTGESSIASLQPLASDFAQLRPLRTLAPRGTAQVDLAFAAPWVPSIDPNTGADSQAAIQGFARIQHARLTPGWLPEPIDIATATAQFGNGVITWANARVSVDGIVAKGSASYLAKCDDPAGCPAQINLDFPALNTAALQSALLGAGHGEFLQAILSRVESPAPPWPALNGTIHAGTLSLGTLRLTNATASIAVRNHRLNILSLDAGALGGFTHASGSILLASGGPTYDLNLTWTAVKLADAGSLFHENWGTGAVEGQARLNLHGYSNLAATATGDFRWIVNGHWGGGWTGGTPGLAFLNTAQILRPKSRRNRVKSARQAQWTASGAIGNQELTLKTGPAQGTIFFTRKLNLEWSAAPAKPAAQAIAGPASPKPPIHITGTLARPVIGTPRHLPTE